MEQSRVPEERSERRGVSSTSSVVSAILLVGLAILALAYFRERRRSAQLAAENNQMATSVSQTQTQLAALTARINAMTLQTPPTPSPSASSSSTEAPPEGTRPPVIRKPTHKTRGPRVVDNERWKKFEVQLGEQQKAIASTEQNLVNTRTDLEDKLSLARDELSGSIARTHTELVALEKKGERNYYEFDLQRSKQFQHVGPLTLSLRKTNVKHEYYDVAMVVDDRQLSKKHVNLYEPLLIYPADARQPLEVVVNQITKNGAHGYVSAPKYPESQNAASESSNTAAAAVIVPTGAGDSSLAPDSLSRRPSQP